MTGPACYQVIQSKAPSTIFNDSWSLDLLANLPSLKECAQLVSCYLHLYANPQPHHCICCGHQFHCHYPCHPPARVQISHLQLQHFTTRFIIKQHDKFYCICMRFAFIIISTIITIFVINIWLLYIHEV